MKWFGICHLGAERALKSELARHNIEGQAKSGFVEFDADKSQASIFLYQSKTMTRLLLAVSHGSIEDIDLSSGEDYMSSEQTFKVEVGREAGAPEDLSSVELATMFGDTLDRPVDLDEPSFTFYVQVATTCVAGIDVAGDLSKRYYRVFANSRSVKGTLAASIIEMFDSGKGLLDPFSNTGELSIEAAMIRTNTSPLRFKKHSAISILDDERELWVDEPADLQSPVWCFDPALGNLRSSKKNAKLAGVEKAITFSKIDPEWMDVKFDENQVASIITIPPPITRRNSDDEHIMELCYQAEYILKQGGKLVVACLTDDTLESLIKGADKYGFKLLDEAIIYSGMLPIPVMSYGL